MRIAVFHNLPSGGALRVASTQVRLLSKHHEVHVFRTSSAGTGPMDGGCEGIPETVAPFSLRPPPGRPFGWLGPIHQLRELSRLDPVYRDLAIQIDVQKFDAVLVHPCQFLQAPSILRHLTTPTLYIGYEPPRSLYQPSILFDRSLEPRPLTWREWRNYPLDAFTAWRMKAWDRTHVKSATEVLTQSAYICSWFRELYGRSTSTIRWGIDTERFHPGRSPRTKNENASNAPAGYFLSVGAMSWSKGFWFLIEAIGLLEPNFRLPLILISDRGTSAEASLLEARARDLGVEVQFQDKISESALVDFYRGATLTLYAPVLEPFGLVPLESMACGTGVVGVAEGGVQETIADGRTGLLTARDPQIFAAAITSLMTDPDRLEELGAAGPAWVAERFTWDQSIQTLESMLESMRT